MGRKKPVSSADKSRKDPFPLHPAFVNPRAATHDATPLLSTSPPKQATSSPAFPDIGKQRHHAYRGATLEEQRRIDARKSARAALESRFIRLPPDVLEHYKTVLAKKAFERPIQQDKAWLDLGSESSNGKSTLLVPKRPKWKYYMLKKEVEKNEAVMFEKWLAVTDETLKTARSEDSFKVMGYFERNLDVWRQLWRVSEASEILLVLLDVRCPLLHFPPSLQDYIFTLKPRKHCILILTKVDLVPAPLAQSWKEYLEHTFEYPVVMAKSYKEHEKGLRTQGTRKRYDPGASDDVRKQLVAALKIAHRSMTTPPERMNPERRSSWKPRCRCDIDWKALETEPDVTKQVKMNKNMKACDGDAEGPGKAEARKARKMQRQQDLAKKAVTHQAHISAREAQDDEKQDTATDTQSDEEDEEDTVDQPPYISIGLIGQPNVGKSSLLNALLSKKVVRASRTPGKTKHLQTIFWTPEVRLVDCPGLVFPSFVGMEKQVLSGIIPIQNVESVIYDLGQRMPLEDVLELPTREEWSTDDLLSTFAVERGFFTAKAARPDVYRAGSIIIRAVQASQIPWAFRPHQALIPGAEQEGIWIKRNERANLSLMGEVHQAEDSTEAEDVEELDEGSEDGSEDEESEPEEKVTIHPYFTSAFGALAVDEAEDSSADEHGNSSDGDRAQEDES